MASQAQLATLEELVACFEDLEDPRSEINRKHPLVSVVAISMMAVLAGADGPTLIHRWARSALVSGSVDSSEAATTLSVMLLLTERLFGEVVTPTRESGRFI